MRIDDSETVPVSRSLLTLIVAVSLVSIGTWATAGIGLKTKSLVLVLLMAAALVGLSAFYTVKRPDPRLARLVRGMAEFLVVSVMIGALSYAGVALARPLRDETFLAWDLALGFDWRFWLGVVNDHPMVHYVLMVAYHSMLPQAVIAVIVLATCRAYARLDTYLLAYSLAAIVAVIISTGLPALSPVVHLGIMPADHPNITLAVSMEFRDQVLALREGRMGMVDLSGAQGLVTFPSFHTVCAVLFLITFRTVPYLRWVSLVLNSLMLISIPIEGSHYLVDVLAGAVLAVASWAAASWFVRREAKALLRPQVLTAAGVQVQPAS